MADRGGPTEQDRSEGMPSTSEAPNERGRALWLLSRSLKVTRRQGGTASSRYQKMDMYATKTSPNNPNPDPPDTDSATNWSTPETAG
ncbi:hypothetical protein PMm318_A48480 [Pseudomonas moorei]